MDESGQSPDRFSMLYVSLLTIVSLQICWGKFMCHGVENMLDWFHQSFHGRFSSDLSSFEELRSLRTSHPAISNTSQPTVFSSSF